MLTTDWVSDRLIAALGTNTNRVTASDGATVSFKLRDVADKYSTHLDEDRLTFTAIATQEVLDDIDGPYGGMDEMCPHLEILRIGTYTSKTGLEEAPTDRQRKVLTTAFERDYFDVSRGVTADELAAEFDLDKSIVLKHLRRAERNLLENRFDTGGTARTW